MRHSLLVAAICLLPAPALAQQGKVLGWKTGDQAVAPNPSQAIKDGFAVMMIVTDDSKGFMKAWLGPTPPHVTTTEQVSIGKPVETMLIFSGCRAAQDGNCNVSVELWTIGPDGKPYGETLTGPIWQGPPAPQYRLQLGQSGIGFSLEPHDKLGTYTLHAKVTDHVARTTLAVEQAVAAVGY